MKGGITSGVLYPSTVRVIAEKMHFVGIGGTSAGAIAAALTAAAEYRRRRTGSFEGFEMLEATAREFAAPGRLLGLFRPDKETSELFETFLKVLQGRLGWWDKANLGRKLLFGSGREELFRPAADNGYGLATGMANGNDIMGQLPITPWLSDLIDKIAGKTDGPLTFRDLHQAPIPSGLAPLMNGADRRPIDLITVTTCITLNRPFEIPFSTGIFAFDPKEWRKFFPERIVKHLEDEAATLTAKLAKGKNRSELDRDGKKPLSVDGLPAVVAARMSLRFPALFTMIPLWAVDYDLDDQPIRRLWFSDGGITSNLPIHRFDSIYPRWPTLGISLRYTDDSGQPKRRSLRKDNSWIYFPNTREALRDLWDRFDLKQAGVARLFGFAKGIFERAQNWHDNAFLRMPGFRDRVIEIWLNSEEGGLNLEMKKATIERLIERGREAGLQLVQRYASDSTELLSWSDHRWARFRSGMPGLIQTILNFKRAVDVDQGRPKLMELLSDKYLPASYKFASEEDRLAAKEVTEGLLALAAKIEALEVYRKPGRLLDGPFHGAPRPRTENGSRAPL
jgi:hypothetical protein